MDVIGQVHCPVAVPLRRNAGTHCIGDSVRPAPVCIGALRRADRFLAPNGIRKPKIPARSLVALPRSFNQIIWRSNLEVWKSRHVAGVGENFETLIKILRCYYYYYYYYYYYVDNCDTKEDNGYDY